MAAIIIATCLFVAKFASVSGHVDCDGCSMFDLSTDPHEVNDLLKEVDDDLHNAALVEAFEERIAYWSQFYQKAFEVEVDKSDWKHEGGVRPWNVSDFVPLEIEQKYHYSRAPHIVFVLVDDWGWNNYGPRSTFMPWVNPTIEALSQEGVMFSNYYSNELCSPSRASLLTGRYAFRLGFQNATYENTLHSELDLDEITIGQEMQSAGYETYIIGKWDVGYRTIQNCPTHRGFNNFYGYYNGFIDYNTKKYAHFVDLQDNDVIVTDDTVLDESYHSGYLFQAKAEEAIAYHAQRFPKKPMFLYYALQLVHSPYEAPQVFLDRCANEALGDDGTSSDYLNFCGLNAMLDEAIANLTCALKANDMNSNTIMVIASDNGGDSLISGSSYPYRGAKGAYSRGGVSATAMVISDLIPTEMRGTTVDGLAHITDWLPTLMHAATDGEWTGGYAGQDIDGYDLWDALTTPGATWPRNEVIHVIGDDAGDFACLVMGDMKFFKGTNDPNATTPYYTFMEDQNPDLSVHECADPSPLFSIQGRRPLPRSSFTSTASSMESALSSSTHGLITFGAFSMVMLFGFFAMLVICSRSPKRLPAVSTAYDGGEFGLKFEQYNEIR